MSPLTAASSSTCVPQTLLSTKSFGRDSVKSSTTSLAFLASLDSNMERSTCELAAKCTIVSVECWRRVFWTKNKSQMSPQTNLYLGCGPRVFKFFLPPALVSLAVQKTSTSRWGPNQYRIKLDP